MSARGLKIQGVLFDLGELAPGAARSVRFHRFGVLGGATDVAAAVAQRIDRIAGARAAPGQR